jgi:hypothetical protein
MLLSENYESEIWINLTSIYFFSSHFHYLHTSFTGEAQSYMTSQTFGTSKTTPLIHCILFPGLNPWTVCFLPFLPAVIRSGQKHIPVFRHHPVSYSLYTRVYSKVPGLGRKRNVCLQ